MKTTKGHWFEIIQNERMQNKVSASYLEISLMSRDKFKRIVETKIEFQAIKYLRELASTHSKSAFILNEKFGKKEYFNDRRFSKEDVQILFKLKTKMTNCKSNFKYQYGINLTCRICEDENSFEDENHILICPKITEGKLYIKFSDVYGDVNCQYRAVKTYKKIFRKRDIYLEMMEKNGMYK